MKSIALKLAIFLLGELFSDWKFDAGIGWRALMSGSVTRVDFAVSNEGSSVWAMLGHPF